MTDDGLGGRGEEVICSSHKLRKWDVRFLRMAREVASWSKDPSTKCGCVVVDQDRHMVSTGYNGFPKGLRDTPKDYANRELKLQRVVHAEMNALLRAQTCLKGHTLYVWPFLCCDRCAPHAIQVGITRVVTVTTPESVRDRWADSNAAAMAMFLDARVDVDVYDPALLDNH